MALRCITRTIITSEGMARLEWTAATPHLHLDEKHLFSGVDRLHLLRRIADAPYAVCDTGSAKAHFRRDIPVFLPNSSCHRRPSTFLHIRSNACEGVPTARPIPLNAVFLTTPGPASRLWLRLVPSPRPVPRSPTRVPKRAAYFGQHWLVLVPFQRATARNWLPYLRFRKPPDMRPHCTTPLATLDLPLEDDILGRGLRVTCSLSAHFIFES
uniref:Uncharacterized protein n=1 Tax=Mycena chlorophos TaxID=658473 RepID=A0ABQ0LU75_MYCCL|nr:predicted protein [Mycena chlorophos]